eukprot:gb/GECG01002022.1/.p1 GENE.gb/GECG01002022.1/~~gb/GECG01002022.1/.p1  ORF type:complete len:1962 (+),score=226.57 gb/GECG01002022.1/:1-5886(+)
MSHRARAAAEKAASLNNHGSTGGGTARMTSLESLGTKNAKGKSSRAYSTPAGISKHTKRTSSGKKKPGEKGKRQTATSHGDELDPPDNESNRSRLSAEETEGVSRNPESLTSSTIETLGERTSGAVDNGRSSAVREILEDESAIHSFERIQALLHRENINLVTLVAGLEVSMRLSVYSVLIDCLRLVSTPRLTLEKGLDVADNLFQLICASSLLGRQVLSDENVSTACNVLEHVLSVLLGRTDSSSQVDVKTIVEKTDKLLHHVIRLRYVLKLPDEHTLKLTDSLVELTLVGIGSTNAHAAESSIRLRKTALDSVVHLCNERRELKQELATVIISCLPKIAESPYTRRFPLPRGSLGDSGADTTVRRQSIGFIAALILHLSEDICSREAIHGWERSGDIHKSKMTLAVATALFSTLLEYCNTGYLSIDWSALLFELVTDILACLGLPEWPAAFHIQWMVICKMLNTLSDLESKKSPSVNERKMGTTAISLLGDTIKKILILRRVCCQYVLSIGLGERQISNEEHDSNDGSIVSLRRGVTIAGSVDNAASSATGKPIQVDHQNLHEALSFLDTTGSCDIYAHDFGTELSDSAAGRPSLDDTKKNLSSLFSLSSQSKEPVTSNAEMSERSDITNSRSAGCPLWLQRVVLRDILHSQMLESVHEKSMRDTARKFCLTMWATTRAQNVTEAELFYYMACVPLPKLVWTDGRHYPRLPRDKFISVFVQSCIDLPMMANLNALLKALLHQASSAVSKWRQRVIECLKTLVEMDEHIANIGAVQSVIETRFMDQSISVRSAVIDLIGNHVEGKPHLVTKFIQPLVNKLDDSGLSVRKQATKILQRLLRAHYGLGENSVVGDLKYEHVSSIFCAFVQRVADSNEEPSVRELILETCFELWFCVPTSPSISSNSTAVIDLILRRVTHLLLVANQFISFQRSSAGRVGGECSEVGKLSNFISSLLSRDKSLKRTTTDYHAIGRSFGDAFKEQLRGTVSPGRESATTVPSSGKIRGVETTGDVVIGLIECSIRTLLTWRHDKSVAGVCANLQIPHARLPACVMLVISELTKCVPKYCLKRLDIFKVLLDDSLESLKQGELQEEDMLSISLCCNTVENTVSHLDVANSQELVEFARMLCNLLMESNLSFSAIKQVASCLNATNTLVYKTTGNNALDTTTQLINSKFYALQKLLISLYQDSARQIDALATKYEGQPLLQKQAAMRGWLAWMHSGDGRKQGKMLQDACFALRTCGVLVQYSDCFHLSTPFEMEGVEIDEDSAAKCPDVTVNLVKLYLAWLHWMTNADFLRPKATDETVPALHYTAQQLIEASFDGLFQLSLNYPHFLLSGIVQRFFTWALRHQTCYLKSVIVDSFNMLLNTPTGRSQVTENATEIPDTDGPGSPMEAQTSDGENGDTVKMDVDPTSSAVTGALQTQMNDIRRQFFYTGDYHIKLRLSTLQLWSNLVSQRVIDPDEGCIPLVALLADWNAQVRQAAWKSIAAIHDRHNSTLCRCSTKGIAAAYSYQCKLYGDAYATPSVSMAPENGSSLSASYVSFFHNFYKKTVLEGGDSKSHVKNAIALIRGLVSKFRCPVYISTGNGDIAEESKFESDSEADEDEFEPDEEGADDVPAGLDTRRGPSGGVLNEDCCPFQEGIRSLSNVNVSIRNRAAEGENDVEQRKYTHDAMLIETAAGVLRGSKLRGEIADIRFLKFLAETLFCLPFLKRNEVYSLCHFATSIISVQGDQSREELASICGETGEKDISEYDIPRIRANCIQLLAVVYLQILTVALSERYSLSEQQLASYNPKKTKENSDGDKKVMDKYPEMEISFPQIPTLLQRQHGWLKCRAGTPSRSDCSFPTLVRNVISLFDGLQGSNSVEFLKEKNIVAFGNAAKRVLPTPSTTPRTLATGSNGATSQTPRLSNRRKAVKSTRSKVSRRKREFEYEGDSEDGQNGELDEHEAYVPRKTARRSDGKKA